MKKKIIKFLKKVFRIKRRSKKPAKKVFCINCRFIKKVKVKTAKTLIVYNARNDTYEKVEQAETGFGCLSGNQVETDYITGKDCKVLRSCKDRNRIGACRSYRKKRWKIWII